MFLASTNLHCELKDRIVQGNIIIDKERVTGVQADRIIEAIAVYTVNKGLISKVQFIYPDKDEK